MNEREKVLQMALILMKHGEPLPIDLLARAEQLGIEVTDLEQPNNQNNTQSDATFQEGEILNGTKNYI